MSNTALVLGVGRFTTTVREDEEPQEGAAAWSPLPFVYDLVPRLTSSFRSLGYVTTEVVDPDAAALRDALERSVGSGGEHCRVLHLISHGSTDPQGDPTRIDVVPPSGEIGIGTNISEWVSSAQTLRHPTLFLLDLCRSGRAARLPFLLAHAGRHTHVWVIAASGTDEDAYDGRFSRAVADVLAELNRTGLGTDSTRRHVAFSAVARHVRQRVESAEGVPQTVLATAMDLGLDEPELPFFLNPRFRESVARRNLLGVAPPLRAFLDDLTNIDSSDADHFTDRAGAHFVGRRSQLRILAPWVDDDAIGGLRVVTGGPGAGKSALMGALVCAAHTELTAIVPQVRARLQAQDPLGCPSQHTRLAAVHARQRTMDDVIDAIVRQLKLPVPEEGWQPVTLIQALGGLTEPPPIVVDALDEAVHPQTVCLELLLPLALATRADGHPVCRLLVGMRPWEQFAPLMDAARAQHGLIDLDAVDLTELRDDLAGYLASVLADLPNYAAREQRAVRERLAATTAAVLTSPTTHTGEWGAFIVGSLLTGYLQHRPPARTPLEAEHIAAAVPTTLPEVLDLDLSLRSDPAALRSVLSAVALAKGNGMPAEVVANLVAGSLADHDSATVQRLLDEARFYLRTGVERDGTTLYRLFHQGLTDHLHSHSTVFAPRPEAPPDPGEVLDRLLLGITAARPGAAPGLGWGTAPAYILRHAVEHAVDAGREEELVAQAEFLVHADTDTLLPVLDHVRGERARSAAAVYRASADLHRSLPPESRRRLLAVDAARHQDRSLLADLSAQDRSQAWMPRWATGFGMTPALRRTLLHPEGVEALTCTTVDGVPVAVTGGNDGVVRVWNLRSGRLYGEPMAGHFGAVKDVICTTVGGRRVVVSVGQDETVRICFLDTGALHREVSVGGTHNTLVAATIGSRPAVVVVGLDLLALDLNSGATLYRKPAGLGAGSSSGGVTVQGQQVVVAGDMDGRVQLWNAETGLHLGEWSTGTRMTAMACTTTRNRGLVFTSLYGGIVKVWDVGRRRQVWKPLRPGPLGMLGLAYVSIQGTPTVLASSTDGQVYVWSVRPRRAHPPLTGHSHGPHVITTTTVDGELKAVTASRDGTARVWDLPVDTVPSNNSQKADHSGNVAYDTLHDVACTTVDGRGVAVTAGDSGLRMWDLTSGRPLGPSFGADARRIACLRTDRGTFAATTGGFLDPTVRIWDLTSRTECLPSWEGVGNGALAWAYVRDRPVVVRLGGGEGFDLLDVVTGRVSTLPSTAPPYAYSLACADVRGRPVAVTGTGDGVLRFWDLETGGPLCEEVQAHHGELSTASCAVVDGQVMAVTGYFGGATSGRKAVEAEACLWELTGGRLQRRTRLRGHTGWVLSTAFALQGGRPIAVTGGKDSVVKLWDVDGACLRTLPMPAPVSSTAVAESGELAVIVSGDLIVVEPAWEEL